MPLTNYKTEINSKNKQTNGNILRNPKKNNLANKINIPKETGVKKTESEKVLKESSNSARKIGEENETKLKDGNIKNVNALTTYNFINNLESSLFHFHKEKIGKNILTFAKLKKDVINYIDIDLFLQKIALDETIFDSKTDNEILLRGFCIQHPTFISTDVLVKKMISCFNFFNARYLNKDNLNNFYKIDSLSSSSNNADSLKNNLNNDLMCIKMNMKDNKRVIIKQIPFGIIDLILKFVELHDKYSKNTLTNEIIDEIDQFFTIIVEIIEIKNKYKTEIEDSKQILNSIRNGKVYRRSIQIQNVIKPPFEEVCFSETLLENKIRNNNDLVNVFNLFSYDSKIIAKELTRVSYKLYSKIEPKEFFKGIFTKKNKLITSPNICASIDRFNKLSFWVIEEILAYDYAKTRAKVIEKFIEIANELKNLNNFSDCMSVISGIEQMIITQLLVTWKNVSNKSNKVLTQIKKLLNFQDNYKNIREQINKCIQENKPYVPFLGIYNKRICFLEEYGPYIKEKSLINVDKIVLVQKILDQFYNFLNYKYDFIDAVDRNNVIMILQCLQPQGEDILDKRAMMLEPNFKLKNKKSRKKRGTNTEIHFKENYEKLNEIL